MSRSIDEKVVELKFDNKQFESGVKTSLGTLDKLKEAVTKNISSKSLEGVSKAAKDIDVSNAIKGIEALQDRFSTLGIVGMRVIQNITDGLMNGMSRGIHAVTDSIISGGYKRAMNIENARFQLQGILSDASEVQAVMDQASESVDGTAYAFDSAAKAASMFTASGVESGDQLMHALKGLAGATATFNADYESMSMIWTKISGQGRVMGDELNQLSNKGINAAASIAQYFNNVNEGTAEASEEVKNAINELSDGMEVTEADIRELVTAGEISFDIFSEAMSETFGEHAKDANKTFTGALSNIKAALARTGEGIFAPLIRQEGPMVNLFNAIRVKVNDFNKAFKATGGLVDRFTKWAETAINKITAFVESIQIANTWIQKFGDGTSKTFSDAHHKMMEFGDGTKKVMTGDFYTPFSAFSDTVDITINLFKAFGSVIAPIASAFKEAFSFDVTSLYKTIENIKNFTSTLKLSEENAKNLHDAFKGVFDFIKLGINLIGRFLKAILPLNSTVGSLGNGFLGLLGSIGRLLTNYSRLISTSNMVEKAFLALHGIVDFVSHTITKFINNFKDGFNIDTSGISKFKDKLSELSSPLDKVKEIINEIKEKISGIFDPLISKFGSFNKVAKKSTIDLQPAINNISSALGDMIRNIDPIKAFLSLLNGTLLAGILTKINSIFKTADNGFKSIAKGKTFIGSLKETIQSVSGAIKTLSKSIAKDLNSFSKLIDAKALKEIAIAIAILSGSLFVLSTIDTDRLGSALAAISTMIVELMGSIAILSKVMSSGSIKNAFSGILDAAKINTLASTLIKMAAAILILSFAVKNLASLSWEDLIKGLAGVTILLLEMIGTVYALEKIGGPKKMAAIGTGLILMAAALLIMTQAVKQLGAMDVDALAKGLISIGALLFGLAGFTMLVGGSKKMISIGIGMILLSVAIGILTKSMKTLAMIDVDGINKGLAAIGGMLLELAIFTMLTGGSKKMLGISIAMVILAEGIKILADVMKDIASISWEGIGKGLAAIGGSLLILSLAIKMIPKSAILSSAGLLLMVFNIKMMAEVLQNLSTMSWEGIGKACTALAGALIILIGAMAILGKINAKSIIGVIMLSILINNIQPVVTVLQNLSTMDWGSIARACTALAGALIILIGAMYLAGLKATMSLPGVIAIAIIAGQLPVIVSSMMQLGTMDWGSIARACTALAGALIILIGAMYLAGLNALMAIPGAIAIAIITQSLIPVAEAMKTLGSMSWDEIGRACAALGAALGILVGALLILEISGPAMLAVIGILTAVAIGIGIAAGILSKALIDLIEGINGLSNINHDDFMNKVNIISEAMGVLAEGLKAFGLKSVVGALAFKSLSEGIAKLAPALIILTNLDPDKIGESMKSLGESFAAFGTSMKSFGLFSGIGANSMLTLSEGIAKLAPALMIMTHLDQGKMVNSLSALGHAFQAFGEALDATPFWGSGMRANGIGALIDNISKLTEVLPPFMALDASRTSTALTTLGTAFKNFGTALNNTPFWGSKTRAEGIGALIDNISTLTEVLPPFMALDTLSVQLAFGTLAIGFAQFGTALNNAPFWGVADRGTAIQTLVNSISTLTFGLKNFQNANLVDVESTLTTIAGAFATFGTTLEEAPLFNSAERATGIATLVEAISGLADGLKKMLELEADTETISSILSSIGQAFKDFGKAISNAPLFKPDDRGTAITNLVDSIDKLVPAIASFKDLGTGNVSRILNAVGEGLKKMGESIKDTPLFNSEGRANALISLATGLDTLANVMVRLNNNLNAGQISTMFGTLAGTVRQFGNALTAFGSDAAMNAQTFISVTEAVASLAAVDATAVTNTMNALRELSTLLGDLSTLNTEDMGSFSDALTKLAKDGLTGFNQAFTEQSPLAVENVTTLIDSIMQVLIDKVVDFYNQGVEQASNYTKGLKTKYQEAYNTGKMLGMKAYSGAYTYVNKFIEVGKFCVEGFIKGLSDSELIKKVRAAAAAMAEEAKAAANAALDENSPSKEFEQTGIYAGEGLVIGLRKMATAAGVAGGYLATSAKDGLNRALLGLNNQIDDILDLNPVITPMVDLTNVISAADTINSLFNSALTATVTRTNAVSSSINTSRVQNRAEEFQNGDGSTGNTYNFVQNNNSPKALSRIEIYRDTKNLIKQYREAVESV